MAEDLWQEDTDPHVAACERLLSDAGAAFLYHVHRDVLRTLNLPPMTPDEVQAVYRASVPEQLVKGDAWSRAQAWFESARGAVGRAAKIRAMVEGVTEQWYARGLLEDRGRRSVLASWLIGRAQGRGQPEDTPADLHAHLTRIVDPSSVAAVEFASERACEHMSLLRDQTRAMLSDEILTAVAEGRSAQELTVTLQHRFGTLNRDWRRVAVTETAQARAHGWLSGIPDGERVEWVAAPDACGHCRRYHGQVFTVGVGPFATHIWPGKTNRGRFAARRARDGRERGEEELIGPTVPLHPVCRCRLVRVISRAPGTSPRMQAYLDALVARASA